MSYKLVWSFTCHLPLMTECIEKTGKQDAKKASSLLQLWVLMGMGMSTKRKYPKTLLLPGTEMPLFDVWGKERKGKNVKCPMLRRFQQTETCLLKCLSKFVGGRDGKHEFCIPQNWIYKRLSSYGLACDLIIWTFWHAALIWRLHSFISKWNFTASHVHFIWGTIYHPSSN